MDILSVVSGGSTVTFTDDEVYILNGALNEVCNALELADFETRMGTTRMEALSLLTQITELTHRLEST